MNWKDILKVVKYLKKQKHNLIYEHIRDYFKDKNHLLYKEEII